MKTILAIGGSNSRNSINRTFASYVANKLENVKVITVDLNDHELPIYSPELESGSGIPENALAFDRLVDSSDGIVLSMAEHNGLHAAAFKNLWDWVSRINVKLWKNKPMLLMAASPGGRGGANVLKVTKELIPHFGGQVIADFSLPSFQKNFQEGELINKELSAQLAEKVALFQQVFNKAS